MKDLPKYLGTGGNVNLAKYLRYNSGLFTVLGIFGAMSVYLVTLSEEFIKGDWFVIHIGIIASLGIVVLIALNINFSILYTAYHKAPNKEWPLLHPVNFNIVLFLLCFNTIIVSIITIALSFDGARYMSGQVLLFLPGTYLGIMLLSYLMRGTIVSLALALVLPVFFYQFPQNYVLPRLGDFLGYDLEIIHSFFIGAALGTGTIYLILLWTFLIQKWVFNRSSEID